MTFWGFVSKHFNVIVLLVILAVLIGTGAYNIKDLIKTYETVIINLSKR